MEQEIKCIFDYGLASNNENKIINFLNRIYKIPFSSSKLWEKEIWDFFSNELIVPYVIETSIEEDEKIIENIKKTFFKTIIFPITLFINFNDIYKELIKIKESIDAGKKLKDYLEYLFQINHHLRKMNIKLVDEEDSRFKNFGVTINPICYELKNEEKIIGYETIYFIIPDKDIEYPIKEWSNKISKKWRDDLKNKFNKKQNKNNKRKPLDSRLRHECFKRDGYKCLECGATNKEKILHCDHIIPVSQGGSDELDNLQTLCNDCNLAKYNKKWNGGNNE